MNQNQPITSHAIHPSIFEKTPNGEKAYDLYSRMLQDRIIYVLGGVDDTMANSICTQLMFLNKEDPEKEIEMYINSPGGVVTSGLAIFDTMKMISAPIKTVCFGQACSMGAFLLSQGETRYATENARIMIHQPSGGSQGQATDIVIQTNEIMRMKEILTQHMANRSNRSYEELLALMERDKFMSPEQTIELGLIDGIVQHQKKHKK